MERSRTWWRRLWREPTRTSLKEAARLVFDDPALRPLLKDVKRLTEIRIDTVSTDTVVSSGYDEKRAQGAVDTFKAFLEDNKDRLAALQIRYGRPHFGAVFAAMPMRHDINFGPQHERLSDLVGGPPRSHRPPDRVAQPSLRGPRGRSPACLGRNPEADRTGHRETGSADR